MCTDKPCQRYICIDAPQQIYQITAKPRQMYIIHAVCVSDYVKASLSRFEDVERGSWLGETVIAAFMLSMGSMA